MAANLDEKSLGTEVFDPNCPYQASGGPADPGSWNRYAYVGGDPVNFNDPLGLIRRLSAGRTGSLAGSSIHSDGSDYATWRDGAQQRPEARQNRWFGDAAEAPGHYTTNALDGWSSEADALTAARVLTADGQMDATCVDRVTQQVFNSIMAWQRGFGGRVSDAMWRGAVYGGLVGGAVGSMALTAGLPGAIAGAVTGSVANALWEIFVYEPIDFFWKVQVSKEFNVEARVDRECGRQSRERP